MFTKPLGEKGRGVDGRGGGGGEQSFKKAEASAYPRLCKYNHPREIKTKMGREKFNNPSFKCMNVIWWRDGGTQYKLVTKRCFFL